MTLAAMFLIASVSNNLPIGLLDAVCYVESAHNPKAMHHHDGKGHSYGLCQLKYATAVAMGYKGKPSGLLDPQTNARLAAKYLRYQLERYDGDYSKAITAYNQGSCYKNGASLYVTKVLNYYFSHRRELAEQVSYPH